MSVCTSLGVRPSDRLRAVEPAEDEERGDPLCVLFVRTTFANVTVHERGVCALLRQQV
jgi:hypothetical protein